MMMPSVSGDDKGDDSFVESLMVRVLELDEDLVRPRRQAVDDERLAARVRPAPVQVIHRHMNVPDARRHREGVRAEYRYDPQVLGAVLDDDPPMSERFRERWVDDDFRRGWSASGTTAAGPR